MKYETPVIEVVMFENEDIVTDSVITTEPVPTTEPDPGDVMLPEKPTH